MFTQALLETGEIAVHQWPDVGIESRRIEALVLAKLWQDLGRSADEPAGKCRLYSGLCCNFVHAVGVAVQKTDRHCDIGMPRDASHQACERSTVESLCHRAVEQQPLVDLDGARAGHERRRLLRADVVEDGPVRAADLQHIAKSPGDEHPDLGALALDDGVRTDRDAVDEALDRGDVELQGGQDADNAARWIVGCRWHLREGERTGRFVIRDAVGERASDINTHQVHVALAPMF
jgi:hypothetical protein